MKLILPATLFACSLALITDCCVEITGQWIQNISQSKYNMSISFNSYYDTPDVLLVTFPVAYDVYFDRISSTSNISCSENGNFFACKSSLSQITTNFVVRSTRVPYLESIKYKGLCTEYYEKGQCVNRIPATITYTSTVKPATLVTEATSTPEEPWITELISISNSTPLNRWIWFLIFGIPVLFVVVIIIFLAVRLYSARKQNTDSNEKKPSSPKRRNFNERLFITIKGKEKEEEFDIGDSTQYDIINSYSRPQTIKEKLGKINVKLRSPKRPKFSEDWDLSEKQRLRGTSNESSRKSNSPTTTSPTKMSLRSSVNKQSEADKKRSLYFLGSEKFNFRK